LHIFNAIKHITDKILEIKKRHFKGSSLYIILKGEKIKGEGVQNFKKKV
jgi:hypothetical protein